LFDGAEKAALTIATGRLAYVHVASGRVVVNGLPLVAGDGLKLAEVPTLTVEGGQQAEVLVFDLASQ
jgi:redox-sensitive bicupin YhaK (pirin superfamily)